MPRSDRVALITGVTGQDGQLMSKLLHSRHYRVIGTTRNVASAAAKLRHGIREHVELVAFDGGGPDAFVDCLSKHRPTEIYNFASLSSGARMFEDPVAIAMTNGVAVTHWLEAICQVDPSIRFCQASSSELFGDTTESPQSESTPFRPRSPYGAAKLYAHNMLGLYRKHHGLFACSALLYNHESEHRGFEFVTRKVTAAAAAIALGDATELVLGDLRARRDWGYAGDYVRAMCLMLQSNAADDYVLSTGITHSIRELCEIAFARAGLRYENHVRENLSDSRPLESVPLTGDSRKARERLNWAPQTSFKTMIEAMVESDIARLRANSN